MAYELLIAIAEQAERYSFAEPLRVSAGAAQEATTNERNNA